LALTFVACQGTELEFSGLAIEFKADTAKTTYCQVNLDAENLQTFLYAVKNHYWYQMYMDDLPIWGIVGEIDEKADDYYIWTHKKFELGWNGDQIVDVNLTSEGRTKLHLATQKLAFTYEVQPLKAPKWIFTD
jgi:transmembrane 9 superfamily protein 3